MSKQQVPTLGRNTGHAENGKPCRSLRTVTQRSAKVTAIVALFLSVAAGARAQESAPRFTVGGLGLVSFNIEADTRFAGGQPRSTDLATVNDFSDSFVLLRVDRQLYQKDRAGVVVGFLFPDARTDLGQVFYNQVNVFYNNQHFGGRLGRSRLSNFLLEFPTLREEDLIEYAFVTNGFSNAENSEFSRYGNILRGQVFQVNSRVILSAQLANWAVTDSVGARTNEFDVNSLSGSLVYRLPHAVRYSGFVRRVGIAVFSQNIDMVGQKRMTALAGAVALNLTRHPLRNFEFRGQGIYNFGVNNLTARDPVMGTLASPRGRARSKYLALVGTLRVLSRPYQLDRFQAAVTGAYKTFPDLDASQYTIVPNVFVRLGQGVDLGFQYQFAQFNNVLAELRGMKRQNSFKLTLSFAFQMMFNNYFGERDDILNMEHGYIP